MRKHQALAAAMLAALAATVDAHAQAKVEAGTLTCSGGEGISYIIGSKKSFEWPLVEGEEHLADAVVLDLDAAVEGALFLEGLRFEQTVEPARGSFLPYK